MTTHYRIRQTSPALSTIYIFVLTFLLLFIDYLVLTDYKFSKYTIFILVAFNAAGACLNALLSFRLSTVITEWKLDETGIRKSAKQSPMFINLPDQHIQWTDIQDYIVKIIRSFSTLHIQLKDGATVTLSHSNYFSQKDDFEDFIENFEEKIESMAATNILNLPAKKGSAMNAATLQLISALLFSGSMVVSVIIGKRPPSLVAIASGVYLAYALIWFYLYRRKQKRNP